MRRWFALIVASLLMVVAAASALMGVAAGSAAAEEGSNGEQPAVFIRHDPALGAFLTDPKGRTLYLFTKDVTENTSACTDACATSWPPFTAAEPLALPMGVPGKLTMFDRPDGTKQVAYNGIPLYYFAKDQQPGDALGEDVGGVWYVVAPGAAFGAKPAEPHATTSAPAASDEVDVTLKEFVVDASAAAFQVGRPYTFKITNAGAMTHEMLIERAGGDDAPLEANGREAEAEGIKPGETKTLTWTFTEPGTYQLACHVPGHYQGGMALTVHVAAP